MLFESVLKTPGLTFDVRSFTKSFANFGRIRHFRYTRHVRQKRHFPKYPFRHLPWILSFHQPAVAIFRQTYHFCQICHLHRIQPLYQGRLLTYHLNFRQPSSKCPPYLLFSSNFPLFKRPIQNMHAAPSLIFYAFESFPTYYNQHNYAFPKVIPQVVVLVRSFVCFCNSFFARIASLIIVWPTISPETSQKWNVD